MLGRRRHLLWLAGLAVLAGAVAAAAAGGSGGASVGFGRVTRTSGCHVRGPLPDPRCTPGARFAAATRATICRRGYTRSVRNVSRATKDAVYQAYGIGRHFDGQNGEVDHLVALELGGSNAVANLFPEAASPRPGSHEKDQVENALNALMCRGLVPLRVAQRMIAENWVAAADWVKRHFPAVA